MSLSLKRLRYHTGTCLAGLRKKIQNPSIRMVECFFRDSNLALLPKLPPENGSILLRYKYLWSSAPSSTLCLPHLQNLLSWELTVFQEADSQLHFSLEPPLDPTVIQINPVYSATPNCFKTHDILSSHLNLRRYQVILLSEGLWLMCSYVSNHGPLDVIGPIIFIEGYGLRSSQTYIFLSSSSCLLSWDPIFYWTPPV